MCVERENDELKAAREPPRQMASIATRANAFALVAMGAVFGAASRAAFTFIIFAFEITRDYNSVLPLMLVTVIADLIAVRYARNSIMTEKLARRGLHIHQDYEPDVLQQVVVGQSMSGDFDTVPGSMTVAELADRIGRHDPTVTHHQGVFVVGENGGLTGIITRSDVMRALEQDPSGKLTVLDASSRDLVLAYPDEVLYEAAARMFALMWAACRWSAATIRSSRLDTSVAPASCPPVSGGLRKSMCAIGDGWEEEPKSRNAFGRQALAQLTATTKRARLKNRAL